jgi:gas vesicle protein
VVDQGMAAASDMAGDLRNTVAAQAEPVTQALGQAAESITERTDALAAGIRRSVHDVSDTVSEAASNVSDKLKGAADAVEQHVSHTYDETRNGIKTTQSSKSAVMHWVDENPLAVAGIGAAIGAFIAAALPPSSAENAALGKSSDRLKDKAREMANDGLEKARSAATGVASDIGAAAAREGLDAPSLRQTADEITQSVKSVAEHGLHTALNGITPPDTHKTQHNTADTHAKRHNTQAGR